MTPKVDSCRSSRGLKKLQIPQGERESKKERKDSSRIECNP